MNYVSTRSRQRSEDLAKKIQENGVKATAIQADISKVAECPKLIEAALGISDTGKIEILIHKCVHISNSSRKSPRQQKTDKRFNHSAALGVDANLVDVTEEIFATHFDTNVKGPIFLTKATEPYLPQGGRVVFVSSAAARLGVAGQTVYAATKAANEALARVWAVELGQSHGITVNCVNPGPVATGKLCRVDLSDYRC